MALGFAAWRAGSLARVGELRLGASEWVMVDFRTVVYYPAKAFADGINPYDADVYQAAYPARLPYRGYPPATLLVHQPFAWLPLSVAMAVQAAVTIALCAVLAWLSLRLSGLRPTFTRTATLLACILLSRPGHWNLLLGQVTLVSVLGVYGTLAFSPTRALWPGLALAVAMLKPTFGVPLAVALLAQGRVPAVAVGGGITILLNAAALEALADRSGGWVHALSLLATSRAELDASDISTQFGAFRLDAFALIARLIGTDPGPIVEMAIGAAVIGLAAYGIRRRRAGLDGTSPDDITIGVVCTSILLCVYHIGYDLILLTWPAVAAAAAMARRNPASVGERARLPLLLVLGANYLGTFTVLQALGPESPLALAAVSLNSVALSALFWTYVMPSLASRQTIAALQV